MSDLSLDYPFTAQGTHSLRFDDPLNEVRTRTPKSVYFNTGCGSIHIGHNVVFGEHVMLLTGKHLDIQESAKKGVPLHSVATDPRNIEISEGCYIGSGAIVIGPVKIGRFSVVSAGAVVMTEVADFTMVAGNPARPIKRLDTEI